MAPTRSFILLLYCPDRKGLVAAIANLLLAHDANILHAAQHQDNALSLFFMRVEFVLEGESPDRVRLRHALTELAATCGMTWQLEDQDRLPAVAVFVSQYLHCLNDLLFRHASGELPCTIPLILSNHDDARALAAFYNIPFHRIDLTRDNKPAAEERQLALLAEHRVDLVVLARYMQVLSGGFCERYPRRIINVHHSFLPAFTGARPYHAAFARGVKLIGSTAHYVTEVLDDGPIIAQDVMNISHEDRVPDLIQKGRDLERLVLSRAVRWHLEHRILSYANKTVIFS